MKKASILFCILLITNTVLLISRSVNAGVLNGRQSFWTKQQTIDADLTENDTNYWLNNARRFVTKQQFQTPNTKIAKNIIMFLGDGMSLVTLAATRPYIGGEEKSLSFEEFPYVGMAKTYCIDSQVADSSCSATAFLNGVKANYGTIGLTAKAKLNSCTDHMDETIRAASIAKWALDAGKSIGFVTTSSVTDATPSNLYAFSANRYWENDVEIMKKNCDPNQLDDIAKQLIFNEVGRNMKVILGGGRGQFRNETHIDEEGKPGLRNDGRDLIAEWLASKGTSSASYVWNVNDLVSINGSETDYLLGLFEPTDMRYHLDVLEEGLTNQEPTLEDMTKIAIDILSKNPNGFFLFVEGGRIDTAHHSNYARIALDETAELAKTVDSVHQRMNDEDTLLVVTSDHSHTMSYSGYPVRHNDIFGMADMGEWTLDQMPMMTLTYANGPGYKNNRNITSGQRIDPTKIDTSGIHFQFPTTVPANSETHGGEDVAVFATGPWSHLFVGSYEQHVIPYLIGYASCIGQGIYKACDN